MDETVQSLSGRWRRRRWRPDPAALTTFAGLKPVTIVTGASEGIGQAFAERLARQGHRLLLIGRDNGRLERVAATLRTDNGPTIEALALDLTTHDALQVVETALARLGGYANFLVNNAGVGISGAFADATQADIEALIALNITAQTKLARHVLPGMLVRGHGGILFVASLAAYTPGPWQAIYYASKAYLLSFASALAAETAGMGVRICCLAPGPVETRFHAKMGADEALYRWLMPSQSADRVAAMGLLGYRWGARVLVPGVLSASLCFALRLLPQRLTLPLISVLLRPRAGQ
jgi:uncharacterized protein